MPRDLPCKLEFHPRTLYKSRLLKMHARRSYIHNTYSFMLKKKKPHSGGRIPREAAGHGLDVHVHGGSEAGAPGRPGHARFAAGLSR